MIVAYHLNAAPTSEARVALGVCRQLVDPPIDPFAVFDLQVLL